MKTLMDNINVVGTGYKQKGYISGPNQIFSTYFYLPFEIQRKIPPDLKFRWKHPKEKSKKNLSCIAKASKEYMRVYILCDM